jgi:glyoxylase-like metal-dependent hydrolase (beta-lactamase superfamily II)
VRILPGTGAEMLLVPLAGHSRGHSAVALKTGDGWLLHCGDAYFHHGEIATPPHCPPGLRLFQNLNNADRRQRIANQERLRELAGRHGDEITFLCSHDPQELQREQARSSAVAAS